jgi:hypothetical protein
MTASRIKAARRGWRTSEIDSAIVWRAWWRRARTALLIRPKASERRTGRSEKRPTSRISTPPMTMFCASRLPCYASRSAQAPDVGQTIWSRFSQPREKTLCYYRSLADKFRERWPGQLADELHEIVEVLDAASRQRDGQNASKRDDC